MVRLRSSDVATYEAPKSRPGASIWTWRQLDVRSRHAIIVRLSPLLIAQSPQVAKVTCNDEPTSWHNGLPGYYLLGRK